MVPSMAIAAEVDTAPAPDSYRDLLLKFKVFFLTQFHFVILLSIMHANIYVLLQRRHWKAVTRCKQLKIYIRSGNLMVCEGEGRSTWWCWSFLLILGQGPQTSLRRQLLKCTNLSQ